MSGRSINLVIMRPVAMTFACAFILVMTQCATEQVTTTDGRPLPPEPRTVPAAPDELQPNRIAFLVAGKPDDSNGNGFPDLIRTTVFLFSTPYPISLHQRGTFVFELYQKGGFGKADERPVRQWRIPSSMAADARSGSQYGPCYQFKLSLLEGGSDMFPLCALDLAIVFQPDNGGPAVYGEGVKSIQLGKRDAAVDAGAAEAENWGSRIRTLTN